MWEAAGEKPAAPAKPILVSLSSLSAKPLRLYPNTAVGGLPYVLLAVPDTSVVSTLSAAVDP